MSGDGVNLQKALEQAFGETTSVRDLGPPDPLPDPTPPRYTDRPEITVNVDERLAAPKEDQP